MKNTLHIEAIPSNLPHEIFVDLTGLETVNDALFVRDLTIPEGVEVLDDESLNVVMVVDMSSVATEEEETAAEEAAIAAAETAETTEEETTE